VLRDRPPERYLLPVALLWEGQEDEPFHRAAPSTLARVRQRSRMGILYDAFEDAAFCRAVVSAISAGQQVHVGQTLIAFRRTSAFADLIAPLPPEPAVRRLTDVRDSAVVLGEHLILRGLRHVSPGINPALELGQFLTEHAPHVHAVPIAGSVEVRDGEATFAVLASLQGYVENQADAWSYTEGYLDRFLTQSLATPPSERRPSEELHAGYCLLMSTLGRRTAELHRALVAARGAPAFQPEAIAPGEPAAWAAALSNHVEAMASRLRGGLEGLSPAERTTAGAFLDRVDSVVACLPGLGRPVHAMKARLHGDLHLGQVLVVGSDVMLVGFGIQATGAPEARRAKHSPLKDVASLLRSLDRAASSALLSHAAERPEELALMTPLVRVWQVDAREALLAGYREGIGDCPAWPSGPGESECLIALFRMGGALLEAQSDLARQNGQGAASLGRLVVLMDALIAGEACPSAKAHTADPSRPAAA